MCLRHASLTLTSANYQVLSSSTVEIRPNSPIVVKISIQEWHNPIPAWDIKHWYSDNLRSLHAAHNKMWLRPV